MARTIGTTRVEKFFRQWYAVKQGGYKFSNGISYSPNGSVATIKDSFNTENKDFTISFPTCKRYLDSITAEIRESGEFNAYTEENFGFDIPQDIVEMKQSVTKGGFASNPMVAQTQHLMSSLSSVDENTECLAVDLGAMEEQTYNFFKTNVDCIDTIANDKSIGLGFSTKNVILAVGESGVGKSTQLLDMVSMVRANNEECKPVYISVEMMKSDLGFYLKKNPNAKNVPTIPLMDWVVSGKVMNALEQIFYTHAYNFIVLDSFQDLLVKLCQYNGLKMNDAQNMLLNMLIASAEKFNKTIIAIQHLTKGGDYVGTTLLKHSVTAMLEYRFDGNDRYFTYTKNRRCGDYERMRIYYNFNKETHTLEYDQQRFDEQVKARNTSAEEKQRQQIENIESILAERNRENGESEDEFSKTLRDMQANDEFDQQMHVIESETIEVEPIGVE